MANGRYISIYSQCSEIKLYLIYIFFVVRCQNSISRLPFSGKKKTCTHFDVTTDKSKFGQYYMILRIFYWEIFRKSSFMVVFSIFDIYIVDLTITIDIINMACSLDKRDK